ncbi:MAG TPA: flagellar biosynthesis anti-sigma factor FlgM [Burkholderiales bacterium]|nr:flagellar biosynthesis anti-sigma factor FlgM [Burkholderiales bacterium]
MKINGSPDPLRLNGGTAAGKGNKATEKTESAAADTVQLSGLPAELAKLVADAQAPNAVFDQSRVDAIKDALRRGEFKVDSGVVAERLIETVQKLVGQKG